MLERPPSPSPTFFLSYASCTVLFNYIMRLITLRSNLVLCLGLLPPMNVFLKCLTIRKVAMRGFFTFVLRLILSPGHMLNMVFVLKKYLQ